MKIKEKEAEDGPFKKCGKVFEVKKVYLDLITIFNIMGNQCDQIGQFIGLWATF